MGTCKSVPAAAPRGAARSPRPVKGDAAEGTLKDAPASPGLFAPGPADTKSPPSGPAPAAASPLRQPPLSPPRTDDELRVFVQQAFPEFVEEFTLGTVFARGRGSYLLECRRGSPGADNKPICAKLLRDSGRSDEETKQPAKEIEALETLRGMQGVVNMVAGPYGPTQGMYIFVLQREAGGHLQVERGLVWPEALVASIVRQLLEALVVMHEANLAHCDVKPSHVLLDRPVDPAARSFASEGAEVRLCGFASATRYEPYRAKWLVEVAESPLWIAPEMWKLIMRVPAAEAFDERCDLWSLGAMAYAMLSGMHPYLRTEHSLTIGTQCEEEVYLGLFESIFGNDLEFPEPQFGSVSHEARHFLVDVLQIDFRSRCNALQALHHPWIRRHSPDLVYLDGLRVCRLLFNFDEERKDLDIEQVKKLVGKGGLKAPDASPTLFATTPFRTDSWRARRSSVGSWAARSGASSQHEDADVRLQRMRAGSDAGYPVGMLSTSRLSPFLLSQTGHSSGQNNTTANSAVIAHVAPGSVSRRAAPRPLLELATIPEPSATGDQLRTPVSFGSPSPVSRARALQSPKLLSPAFLPKECIDAQVLRFAPEGDDGSPEAAAAQPPPLSPPHRRMSHQSQDTTPAPAR